MIDTMFMEVEIANAQKEWYWKPFNWELNITETLNY